MTMPYSPSRAVYEGNNAATRFPFFFRVWDASQLVVTLTSPKGVTSEAAGWTADLDTAGGEIAYLHENAPLPDGWKLAITRNMPFTQEVNLVSASRFDPQVIEDALDQAAAERQQTLEMMRRAVILPATSSETPQDVVLAVYAARDDAQNANSAAEASKAAAGQSAAEAEASANTAEHVVQAATADAVSAATAQADAAASSAAAAAQSAIDAAAAVPENLVQRVTDVEQTASTAQSTANTAKAVTDTVTPTPTANAVPQADADGRLDRWCFYVGEFYYFRHPTLKPGFAPLQGGLISGAYQGKNITEYPIWAYLQTSEGQLLCKTEAQWQAMTKATWATLADDSKVGWNGIGGAPFYVQNLSAGTLRMPDLRGMYAEAAGFASLGVGEARIDHMRRLSGSVQAGGRGASAQFTVFTFLNALGAFDRRDIGTSQASFSVAANTTTDLAQTLLIDSGRTMPVGPVNAPRRWGALACAYLGRPAS